MLKNHLILLTFITFLFFSFDTLFSCTCTPPVSATEELEKSDAVFTGKVLEVITDTINAENTIFTFYKIKFEISAVWKGVNSEQVVISTSMQASVCGFLFEQGIEYIVYAFNDGTSLSTNICTRTKKLSEAQEDLNELGTPVIVNIIKPNKLPESPTLQQNYPNPFNPVTQITFSLLTTSHVTMIVTDLLGREIQTLVDEIKTDGTHLVTFDANRHASGIYFYHLQLRDPFTNKQQHITQTKKMLLLR